MESRGQTRHAPNSRKQATTSSAAFIGWPDYSPEGPRRRSGRLAGRADEPAQHEVLEAGLELVGDFPSHRLRIAGPLALRAGGPAFQVGVTLGDPFPHRDRVDQILESLRERYPHRRAAVLGFHERRQVAPLDDPVSRHRAVIVAETGPFP